MNGDLNELTSLVQYLVASRKPEQAIELLEKVIEANYIIWKWHPKRVSTS